MSRVVGVFSGKGGVGKTTLVANLGTAITNVFNKNAVIFDMNVHTSHLGLYFGLYEDMPVTLRDVMKKRVPLTNALYIHPTTGVRIIPAPLNGTDLVLTKNLCCNMVDKIKDNYDMVLLDCAPGLGREVLAPMCTVDEAIVISTPDIISLADAIKTIEILKKLDKKVLGIVLNRYRNERYELTPQEVQSTTNTNVISIIPEDGNVPNSISKGMPTVLSYPYSKSSIAFKKLAAMMSNERYEEETIIDKLMRILNLRQKKTERPIVQQQVIKSEASDLTSMKTELLANIKDELKAELKKKVKKRLMERLNGKIA